MPRCGLLVGSLALSLGEVISVRQRVETGSAAHAVQAISALLQERNMGHEELLHQISEYATAAVTPGAADSYGKSFKVVANDIETQIEKKITEGQAATQGKLESRFKAVQDANAAANSAKTTAVSNDKSWFECAVDEQAKRQAAEAAEKSHEDSRNNENEACQLQQDNKGFSLDANGKYKLDFECDHSADGNCAAALKAYQAVLQKMSTDAEAALKSKSTHYNGLKATCDTSKQEQVQAQSSLDSAESAWSTKRAACAKLSNQREMSMCAFGAQAQAKCSAEAEFTKLVAATQQVKGDADSEVDRESEWMASRSTKCMMTKAMQKGLDGAVAGADLDACAAEVDFNKDVGKLNTRQAELAKLSRMNACANGVISFFNGQTWNIPAGAKPPSKAYTRSKFTPQLDPTSGNFDFCSAA